MRDEAGRVLIRNFYLGSWLVRQQYSNGASCEIRYRMGTNRRYAEEATVAFASGETRSFRTADSVPQLLKDLN